MRRGWYSRGYLPHVDIEGATQFVTWRLSDSLPAGLIDQWRAELRDETEPRRKRELYRRVEQHLDGGHGSLLLWNPVAAKIVQDALIEQHGNMYELHAWVVMPNHVHALLTPLDPFPLSQILKKLKGGSSFRIGKRLIFEKPLWEPDYFDRWMRDRRHFDGVLHYIEWNPVKAKLFSDPALWPYSSANNFWHRGL